MLDISNLRGWLLLIYVCLGSGVVLGYADDSVRMEKRGAYWFVVHRVEQGETLYGLSKRYDVQIADIYKHNPSLKAKGLRVGEALFLLKQALHTSATTPEAPTEEVTEQKADQFIFHEVQPGESLYGIARQYGVKVDKLRNWNHLPDYTVYAGSRLSIFRADEPSIPSATESAPKLRKQALDKAVQKHQISAGETLYRIALNYGIALGDLMRWNDMQLSDTLRVGQWLRLAPKTAAQTPPMAQAKRTSSPARPSITDPAAPTRTAFSRTFRSKQVVQEGFAAPIPHSDNAQQYYALHRSAPVGTFIRVKNQINARVILVRVIGEVPDTDSHEPSLIYITQKAYAQLGVPDARCPVEISYFSD